jgi:N6-adenosine-specific RNA methylase IME4
MTKFNLIVCDPPYSFNDNLSRMKDGVKRSAASQYNGVLTIDQIKNLRVPEVSAEDAVLALWVPSSFLQEGLDIVSTWGFEQKQTFIWVKTKLDPLKELRKYIHEITLTELFETLGNLLKYFDNDFSLNDILSFGMGRIMRNCHEVCLISIKGKPYPHVKNKSQRSVLFDINKGHSTKPEGLQDRLELIFPEFTDRLELFARRDRPGWVCCGNSCPSTLNEDIVDSIERLKADYNSLVSGPA